MSGSELAALVAAIGGTLGAIFAGVRNLRSDKFKRDVDASAALLAGYGQMVATLQTQITQLQEAHARDREEWLQRERELRESFARELAERDERIDELGTQVYVLQNRPPESRSRQTDRRKP